MLGQRDSQNGLSCRSANHSIKEPMDRKKVWYILLIAYVCMIYGNSLMPADISSMESGHFLEMLLKLSSQAGLELFWLTEHIVRKGAHFTEYAGLGILLIMSFSVWRRGERKGLRAAVELGAAVPFVDETIQLFVRGRSGQISDVWLDMCGVAAGMAVTMWLMGRKRGGWRET